MYPNREAHRDISSCEQETMRRIEIDIIGGTTVHSTERMNRGFHLRVRNFQK
jgi:hypothetical protein